MTREITIPEGVEVSIEGKTLLVKGPLGELKRTFDYPKLLIELQEGVVALSCKNATKKDKMFLGTFTSIVKNIFLGVTKGFEYKLKICSSHFPVSISFKNNTLTVKNFLGEKKPRVLSVRDEVKLKVDGEFIILNGIDKELVGDVAGRIEKLTRVTNRDRRRFQDGIFIVEKAGKSLV